MIKVIPAGRKLSDAALRQYANLNPDGSDIHGNISPKIGTYKSLKGPAKVDRLIIGYFESHDADEAYLIAPVGILGVPWRRG